MCIRDSLRVPPPFGRGDQQRALMDQRQPARPLSTRASSWLVAGGSIAVTCFSCLPGRTSYRTYVRSTSAVTCTQLPTDERSGCVSIVEVIEITSTSPGSFEDAIRKGIAKAQKSIDNVRGAWISEQKVDLAEDGTIRYFRVDMKLTFLLDD